MCSLIIEAILIDINQIIGAAKGIIIHILGRLVQEVGIGNTNYQHTN